MAGHDKKLDTTRTPESSVPEYSETGVFYEKEDVSPRAVTKVGVILVLTAIGSAALTLGLFKILARLADRAETDVAPPAAWSRTSQPPEPRLQATIMGPDGKLTSQALDLAALRDEERAYLSHYGWVDKQAGIVHMDIEDAMRLYAERGAAAVPAPAVSPADPGKHR